MEQAILEGLKGLIAGFLHLDWRSVVMIIVGFVLLWLGIKKDCEPLLLVPIGFGCILTNIPLADLMGEEGLDHRLEPDFQLWIMVEVPSACLLIEEFCKEGIDGVSFGTNDLTMLVLGVDRNDTSVQELYDERDLAVLRAIAYTITVCRKYGVTTSICGQAPSVYPDYLEFMIRLGCTSISVNPDRVTASRHMAAVIEQKIQLEKALGQKPHPRIAKMPMESFFFWRNVEP